jgi:histidinol-phosphatase
MIASLADILQFALSLAEAAERQILPVFRNCTVTLKSDGSEVTEADRRAEEVMRELIGKRFPGHLVLGEEYGGPAETVSEPMWVLDPVDGTTSFVIGVPLFGTLIGYLEHGEPLAGVIHLPALGETVWAARGHGCWYRIRGGHPRPLRVSGVADLRQAFVSACSASPSDIHPPANGPCYKLSAVIPKARKFRFISDCVQHALVAQARIDVAIDLIMNPWDIAAVVPCVEEAGGVVTDADGHRERIVWRPSLISSSGKALHEQVLRLLQDRLF